MPDMSFAEYEDQFDCFVLAFLTAGKEVSVIFTKIDEVLKALKKQGWKTRQQIKQKPQKCGEVKNVLEIYDASIKFLKWISFDSVLYFYDAIEMTLF